MTIKEKRKEHYLKNKETYIENAKAWIAKNPEKHKESSRKTSKKSREELSLNYVITYIQRSTKKNRTEVKARLTPEIIQTVRDVITLKRTLHASLKDAMSTKKKVRL